jgi:hypothetical protein
VAAAGIQRRVGPHDDDHGHPRRHPLEEQRALAHALIDHQKTIHRFPFLKDSRPGPL